MTPRGFIQHVELVEQRVPSVATYPFVMPAVQALRRRLVLHPQVTILVGENGSGKSTLPGALIYALSDQGITTVAYEDTECVLAMKAFLDDRVGARAS